MSCVTCAERYCPRCGGKTKCRLHVAYDLPLRFKAVYRSPEAECPVVHMGGYVKDMQQPLVSWRDDPKRPAVVRISSLSWRGCSGHHVHVNLEESRGGVLDAEGKWCSPWDFKEYRRTDFEKFRNDVDSAKWIRAILLEWYPLDTQEVILYFTGDYEHVGQWLYKEGD